MLLKKDCLETGKYVGVCRGYAGNCDLTSAVPIMIIHKVKI